MSFTSFAPAATTHQVSGSAALHALLPDVLAALPVGLVVFDAHGRLIGSNRQWQALWDWPEALTAPGISAGRLHQAQRDRLHPGAPSPDSCADGDEPQLWRLADGRTVRVHKRALRGGGWFAMHEDLGLLEPPTRPTATAAADQDAVTGLSGRKTWIADLDGRLRRLAADDEVAVLSINLQQFRRINQAWGQARGDAVLRGVAARLSACLRNDDRITRLGADEFAVMQVGARQPQGATAMARRIAQALDAPLDLDGQAHAIPAGIGIAVAPFDGADADALMRKAHCAERAGRLMGPQRWCFFEPEMEAADRLHHALEQDLRRALAQDQFELDYQPQYDLGSGQVRGAEALLRWRHPVRGRIAPMDFIPLAEESGLIVPIGRWVLQQACQDALAWPEGVRVAVNVSAVQFSGPSLVQDVRQALASAGLPAHRLELEITEAVLMRDVERTLAMLQDLHTLGVHLAMDDFGTGYSSLSYLQRFPFDRLKIDRSFVRDLQDSTHARAIVRAVTALGQSLGMAVTVEGVEHAEQLALVRAEGCNEAQGFLFSRPVPAAEIDPLLRQPGPRTPDAGSDAAA